MAQLCFLCDEMLAGRGRRLRIARYDRRSPNAVAAIAISSTKRMQNSASC
jgi:uncharacterized protein with PIN domain